MNGQNGEAEHADYVPLELSRTKWLVGALLLGSEKVITIPVAGGDTDIAALSGIIGESESLKGRAACLP